jgi:hypothetical protein
MALVAVTKKAYPPQVDGQVTVIGDETPTATIPAGVEVTVYPVMGLPPLFVVPTLTLTVLGTLPKVAVTLAGAPGTAVPEAAATDMDSVVCGAAP